MNLTEKGQGIMETLMGIPITILGLVIVFILLEPFGQVLFDLLDVANSEVIGYISTIKLIVGIIGLIVVIMVIVNIIKSFNQPPQYSGGFQ